MLHLSKKRGFMLLTNLKSSIGFCKGLMRLIFVKLGYSLGFSDCSTAGLSVQIWKSVVTKTPQYNDWERQQFDVSGPHFLYLEIRIKKNSFLWELSENIHKVLVAVLCPTLYDPMNCSPPGSSVHGILQARTLEWVAIPFSRGSSPPRDQTQVSCITGGFFHVWATREAQA